MSYETTARKGIHGWEAASEAVLEELPEGQRILKLRTAKSGAAISATASVCIRKDCGGYFSETHALFQDFYVKGIAATPCKRVTEKAVREVHSRALHEMNGLIAEAKAHYADQAKQAA